VLRRNLLAPHGSGLGTGEHGGVGYPRRHDSSAVRESPSRRCHRYRPRCSWHALYDAGLTDGCDVWIRSKPTAGIRCDKGYACGRRWPAKRTGRAELHLTLGKGLRVRAGRADGYRLKRTGGFRCAASNAHGCDQGQHANTTAYSYPRIFDLKTNKVMNCF
jgi:hypothetical protein